MDKLKDLIARMEYKLEIDATFLAVEIEHEDRVRGWARDYFAVE